MLFSRSVLSDSLPPHGLQHARLSCPSLSPRVCSNSSIESMMPFNHLILCRPLLLLPSIFPSIRVFSNELALHIRWPKYWSFSLSISPSNEYLGLTGLISLLSKGLSRVFSCMWASGKDVQGRESSQCKGPEVRTCRLCSRSRTEAPVSGGD